ncbi:pirin family protein [Thioalkalivibrio thiocyanodenitrificans]|uniref:pirin family protein n=1 Tax=Thioalkalivibrio thiocyanodenitrificans TaxID=243063 RepID=UPI0003A61D45|nr:pirin family protein [Thioalkalivibrio thiocyanodenitrificans]
MKPRTVKTRIGGMPVSEGAGVQLRRSLGTPALKNLDPFLMLDHFSSDNPDDYVAGFPDHPHRGFITFTYMLNGHMEHRDSMGNQGDLKSGGAQWMKAASGVIHSEMPRQQDGLMRGFQLWINLPAREKMSDPAYQEYGAGAFPVTDEPGARVKVLMGSHGEARGPIEDPLTDVHYLDLTLEASARFSHALPEGHNAFIYVYEGAVNVGDTAVSTHELAVLVDGEGAALEAADQGARVILVAGRPIGEPIVQYGPFVMNRREEIEQAFQDYQQDRLVRTRARMEGHG